MLSENFSFGYNERRKISTSSVCDWWKIPVPVDVPDSQQKSELYLTVDRSRLTETLVSGSEDSSFERDRRESRCTGCSTSTSFGVNLRATRTHSASGEEPLRMDKSLKMRVIVLALLAEAES